MCASASAAGRIDILHVTQRESSTVARALRPCMPATAVVMHIVDSTPVPRVERHIEPFVTAA